MAGARRKLGLRTYALLAVGLAVSTIGVGRLLASDHMDTPEVELNPRMDINDVYAFPTPGNASNVTLVMTTSSPIAGQSASFDPNLLYQLKVDNNGDGIEDAVFQITFDNNTGASQNVTVRGPVAPVTSGVRTTLATGGTVATGTVGTTITSGSLKAFAGLRADPFFIDLEQFFKILPDRRPSTGALSIPSTQTATSFRSPGVDLLRPFNALAIVIEVPKSQLQPSTAADAKFGLWGTISR